MATITAGDFRNGKTFEMDGSIIPNNFDGVPSAQPLQKRYYDHDSIAVSLIGGLTGMGALLTEKFHRVLEKQLPQCRYYKPVLNPIIGAAIYVMYEFEHVTSLPLMFMENLKYGMEE